MRELAIMLSHLHDIRCASLLPEFGKCLESAIFVKFINACERKISVSMELSRSRFATALP